MIDGPVAVGCTVVGEALIDLVATDELGGFVARPGGSPFNVAITLARLGCPVSLVARTGRDAFGALLRERAVANGVDVSRWPDADEPTSVAVATLDASGQASYGFYLEATAALRWDATDLADAPTGVLHVGSIASWQPPGHELVYELQRRAHAGGRTFVSYDPNVRPALMGAPSDARAVIERSVAVAHLVKASDEDLHWLYPDDSIGAVAGRWCELGADLVVVTLGGSGAVAYAGTGLLTRRAAPVVDVIDTVGAGDSFTGGLLAGLAEHDLTRPDGFAAAVTAGDPRLEVAIDQAVLVAAMTCERRGADPPTRAELLARSVSRAAPTA